MNKDYKYGFSTNVEIDCIKKGLSAEIIHLISKKKKNPNSCLNSGYAHSKNGKK